MATILALSGKPQRYFRSFTLGIGSNNVQFWKQFFEASANVSLSGYEELANDDESENVEESTAMRDDITDDYTAQHNEDVTTATGAEQSTFHAEDSMLDDAELSGAAGSECSSPATLQM